MPGSGSDLDDDIQIVRGRTPDQYRESQAFVQHVQETMRERGYGDFQVTHTGHSLGAALADLHATGNGQRAITFDNPGTQEMLRGLGRPYNPDDLISYQSNPNVVNQANTQAGHSVRVGLNDEVNMLPRVGAGAAVGTLLGGPLGGVVGAGVGGIVGAAQKTLHDHSIDSIVDALDPGSGFPRRTVSD